MTDDINPCQEYGMPAVPGAPIKIVKDKRMEKLKHLYALHKLAKEARRKINEERDGFTIVSGSFKLTFAVEQC